jgi:hypothetical protein
MRNESRPWRSAFGHHIFPGCAALLPEAVAAFRAALEESTREPGGTTQWSSRCDAALSSTSCVSLHLMDMFEPSRFWSRPVPAPH